MDAATAQPSEQHGTARSIGGTLLFGAVLLLTMALWLRAKHEGLSTFWAIALALLGAAAIGLAVWRFVVRVNQSMSAEQKAAVRTSQEKMAGLLFVATGFFTVFLGGYLLIWQNLDAFGEGVGLMIFGLVVLVLGRNWLRGVVEGAPTSSFLEGLRKNHAAISLALIILGAIGALTALGLILLKKVGWEWAPETLGLLLLGLTFMGCGVWLFLASGPELSLSRMRYLVLVLGGLSGLIIALATLGRALIWREDVFAGGLAAWQGPNAWRVWLCAYVGLGGLALMFASLVLGKADVRVNPVLRRTLYGYNAVLTGLLLLAFLIVLNIVFYAQFPFSFDWSASRGLHTLSPSTKSLLANLDRPTSVFVTVTRAQLLSEVNNMLDNAKQVNPGKFHVKYLNPDNVRDRPEIEDLSKRFPEIIPEESRSRFDLGTGRGLLIVYGSLPSDVDKKVPHSFIHESKLFEQEMRKEKSKPLLKFNGEVEMFKELSFLIHEKKKRKLYFLQDHDELDVLSQKSTVRRDLRLGMAPLGMAILAEWLKKDNYDVLGLSFAKQVPGKKDDIMVYAKAAGDKKKDVPDDAYAVILAGPSKHIPEETIEALERYMDRGGRMIVMLDVVQDEKATSLKSTGIEDFLRKYGVQANNEFVMRATLQEDPRNVLAIFNEEAKAAIAKQFGRIVIPLDTVRVVRPEPGALKYRAEVLLHAPPRSYVWADSAMTALNNPVAYVTDLERKDILEAKLSVAPIPVALTVSEDGNKPRMVVFGDAEFVCNYDIMQGKMRSKDVYYSLLTSAIEWMSDKSGLVGPRPKTSNHYSINSASVDTSRMILIPFWLMAVSIGGLGLGIWVTRRR
ncbi:MAG: GldG family protein [Gemmataceae bacterium]|nr:GldG family protein [Gemmataceae bacterium]MCI0742972.1 GldG family protein [Gemmataceae bacterium]